MNTSAMVERQNKFGQEIPFEDFTVLNKVANRVFFHIIRPGFSSIL